MTDALRTAPEYQVYQRVRAAVLEQTGGPQADGTLRPSAYWTEELENIDYMVEASPLIVRKLRHHSFHLTGIRPYDYRTKDDSRRTMFEARLAALRELGGDDLLVPESPALGGFGYAIDGRLFNVDTIKFYEVFVGMERGGVLSALGGVERPVVCEIGAGWGGFAFQFKTLVPGARYVIVDFPELFLFSATYLGSLFPDARLAFVGAEDTPTLAGALSTADFVFLPHTLASQLSSVGLDLTVNMVSFQEMTGTQVRDYAALVADARCALLYSLNRERSPYNTELDSVSAALSERYTLTEVSVLGTDYTSAMKKAPKATRPAERSEFTYRHFVGRLDPSAQTRGAGMGTPSTSARVVLGMTLHNNARYLRESMDSLLAQTYGGFRLVLLDDASTDDTESIAREYTARDPRVSYYRHETRQAMIATWRNVVQHAIEDHPSAEYFAWASDHDRWHPEWLRRMVTTLDADSGAVLAYPVTRRIGLDGTELDKGPRMFDTADCADLGARWRHMCHEGVGAGDMVYGLMRVDALRKAGIYRTALRPDRLLVAELTLYGRFRQVPEVLWYRRDSSVSSVDRQRHSLVLPDQEPAGYGAPPWLQHARILWRLYASPDAPPLPISRATWARMLARYQITYGWRHFRKTEASHAIGRGIDNVVWTKKITKHYWHHAVYNTLVGARAAWGKVRRAGRRAVYEVLMLTHRLGLRGGKKAETP